MSSWRVTSASRSYPTCRFFRRPTRTTAILIDDGLATVTALSQLLTLYNKALDNADDNFEWPHNLVEIVESGFPVKFVA